MNKTFQIAETTLNFQKIDNLGSQVIFDVELSGINYKFTVIQNDLKKMGNDELISQFSDQFRKMIEISKLVDLKGNEKIIQTNDNLTLEGRGPIESYQSGKLSINIPSDLSKMVPKIIEINSRVVADSVNANRQQTLESSKKATLLGKIKTFFSNKEKTEKINFLGGVAISGHAWDQKDGKSLWRERYGLESLAIRKLDNEGKPCLDKNNKPIEYHIYATTLSSTQDEWLKKINNGEIDGELRFDRYVEAKMQNNPKFKNEIISENVRFFDSEELEKCKATFDKMNGNNIQQAGIDGKDGEGQKNLQCTTEYAFVIGKANSFNHIVYNKDLPLNSEVEAKKQLNEQALFLAPKGKTDSGMIQHSSFLRSGKVASAGMIRTDEKGKIKTIVQYSGHYLPEHAEMATALNYLEKNLDEKDFKNITLSINVYTGLMLKATMGINTIVKREFNKKLDLGMVDVKAHEWLENYKITHPEFNSQ